MEWEKLVTNLESSVGEIEQHLQYVKDAPSLPEVRSQLGQLENAKLHSALAYTLDSLFFMYLRTRGVNPADHPVKTELDRIKKYIGKINRASKAGENATKGKAPTASSPPAARVDRAAAARFISSALSGEGGNKAVAKEIRASVKITGGSSNSKSNNNSNSNSTGKGKGKSKGKDKSDKSDDEYATTTTHNNSEKAKTKSKSTPSRGQKRSAASPSSQASSPSSSPSSSSSSPSPSSPSSTTPAKHTAKKSMKSSGSKKRKKRR